MYQYHDNDASTHVVVAVLQQQKVAKNHSAGTAIKTIRLISIPDLSIGAIRSFNVSMKLIQTGEHPKALESSSL
jgi:hypothetical protein